MDAKIKRIGALSAGLVAIGLLVFVTMLSSPVVSDNIDAGDTCMTEVTLSGDAALVVLWACQHECNKIPEWWRRAPCLVGCGVIFQRAMMVCRIIPHPIARAACIA